MVKIRILPPPVSLRARPAIMPPPTRYGAAPVQAKLSTIGAGIQVRRPPVAFSAMRAAQAKPNRPAPPPTRYGAGGWPAKSMVPPALRPQDAVGRPTRVLQPAAALPTPVANATAAGGAAAPTATAASAADAKNQSDDEDYYLELVKKEKYKDYDMLKDRYSFIAFEKCKETILNIAGISISNPTSSAEISDIVDRLKGNIKK